MNVIFMGTPDFAVPSLQNLISLKEHNVVAVFSQRPKSKGRGMKIAKSPVHELADLYKIPVYTPSTLRKNESFELIDSISADIIVVVAYGFIIPKNILESKKYGCLNIHPSKLPKYRGAAPLQRTIIEGEKETAVCIMQMDEGLDTGDIILQENFALGPRITLQELHDKCAQIGAKLLLKTLNNIETLPRIKQSDAGVTYAHKLTKEESLINWNDSAFKIDCMVRGMNPWPGVFFEFKNKKIKILETEYSNIDHSFKIGQILNKSFDIACAKGILHIKSVKPEGKPQMSAKAYLNGNNDITVGSII
ncbi:MAG: methionyl-tRNA formyltransferase [Rickettsiaceae bacterium]|nr:methionyl-tRNA formyltransferase [Rickettsiaceae bacterium]